MKIGLIGYGTMGQTIERIAKERGHEVPLIIDIDNQDDLNPKNLKEIDAVIEFTVPSAAVENIKKCISGQTPVVCGTTGWLEKRAEIEDLCKKENGCFLYASNFSLGVNIFFELNKKLAQMMNKFSQYDVRMEETHHTRKLDAPSGTAITLAEGILSEIQRKDQWVLGKEGKGNEIAIEDFREGDVPGIHTIKYESDVDSITITHDANNRDGFALGSVLAAEFVAGKKGIFSMQDVLFGS